MIIEGQRYGRIKGSTEKLDITAEELAKQLTDEDITELAKQKHIVSIQAPPQEIMCRCPSCGDTHTKELEKLAANCPNCGHPLNDRGTDREHPEEEKPEPSICDRCVENCKATHPRICCYFFKPAEPRKVIEELDTHGLKHFNTAVVNKINELCCWTKLEGK